MALKATKTEANFRGKSVFNRGTLVLDDALEISDLQLWQAFQLGNQNAYAKIYKNYVSSLYNYGLRIVNNDALVKDCIQDLFVEIWNKRESLGKVQHIKSYLYTAIRRKLISEAKQSKVRINSLDVKNVSNRLVSVSMERKLVEKQNFDEQVLRLNSALAKLTNKQKEALYLKYNAQLGYNEISQIMGLTKKGSYKLIDRAIKGLRKYMVK